MKRPKVGDVVEIETPKGLAYALYSHKNRQYGTLLRVFDKVYKTRPGDIGEVAKKPVQFSCFFPLGAAVARNIVSIIGNIPIPDKLATFPIFRSAGLSDPRTGKVSAWWFWDGEREWRVGRLTLEQRKMPIRGIWNDTLLIERIVSGWTAGFDPR